MSSEAEIKAAEEGQNYTWKLEGKELDTLEQLNSPQQVDQIVYNQEQ